MASFKVQESKRECIEIRNLLTTELLKWISIRLIDIYIYNLESNINLSFFLNLF